VFKRNFAKLLLLSTISTLHSEINELKVKLSYDDVLIVPRQFPLKSRLEISLNTRITKNIKINIPIVSANMDTVTESEMAIKMAQIGGLGIIHRFNTIEDQVKEVQKVKRFSNNNAKIENPLTIYYESTLEQAREIMHNHNITCLLVVDQNQRLNGILTLRDMRFLKDETKVSDVMTRKENLVVADYDITIEDAIKTLKRYRLEKLPLITKDWQIKGLITSKDITNKSVYPNAALDSKNRLLVGAAIGVKEDALERAKALVQAEVDILVIDVAHGHSTVVIDLIKSIKKLFPQVDLIAGNVATEQGTKDLIQAGADAIKVGVGPGSICTTRITTGSGYPQLSAIIECAKEADKYGVPIIADGGIKYSGDITKAIVAGASTVMLGSLLAGTEESPGQAFIKDGKKFKVIRGMASFGAQLGRAANGNENKTDNFTPEGVEATVPYRGLVREVLGQLLGGLRSGLSYCGATKIEDARAKCNFVTITSSGMRESKPHDVDIK
jgi:IMP dehydrogenase